jgi:hypothetical protein
MNVGHDGAAAVKAALVTIKTRLTMMAGGFKARVVHACVDAHVSMLPSG